MLYAPLRLLVIHFLLFLPGVLTDYVDRVNNGGKNGRISDLGINCRGSGFFCWGANGMIDFLTKLTPYLNDEDVWVRGAHITCFPGKSSFLGNIFLDPQNGFCLFLQGDPNGINQIVYPDGSSISAIDGATVKLLIVKLKEHGCNSCSSVPLSPDNDPHRKGILTLNFVKDRRGCGDVETQTNLCPPTFPAGKTGNPYAMWHQTEDLQNGDVRLSPTSPTEQPASSPVVSFGNGAGLYNGTAAGIASISSSAPLKPCGDQTAAGANCAPSPVGVIAVSVDTPVLETGSPNPGDKRMARRGRKEYEYGRGRLRNRQRDLGDGK